MTKLLGFHGKARVGKDTAAMILRIHHGFQRMAFADPLKRSLSIAFGIPEDIVFSDIFKETVVQPWNMTGRSLLQKFGTESMRDVFAQDFWIKRWDLEYQQIKDFTNVVLTDVRFEDEASRIRECGGVIVHLQRSDAGLSGTEGSHRSESGIEPQATDVVITNNGTIGELAAKLSACLQFIDQSASKFGYRA